MNTKCKKKTTTTTPRQNILHEYTLYNIKRKKYKTVCAELAFTKVTFDSIDMAFCGICDIFCFIYYAVGLLQYSKSARSKLGTPMYS